MELAEGRGRAGGCGYSERRRRSLSGACERKNRGGDGDEGVSGRVPGVGAAPRGWREASRCPGDADEQGGGVASSGARAVSLLCLLARGSRWLARASTVLGRPVGCQVGCAR